MGQTLSCCIGKPTTSHNGDGRGRVEVDGSGKVGKGKRHDLQGGADGLSGGVGNLPGSASNLQHISEREPDDEEDPSSHPKAFPIFMQRSKSELLFFQERKRMERKQSKTLDNRLHKRYSSCSTIFLDDNTVTQPNLKAMLKCVSFAICYHIKNRESSHRNLEILDEKLHPLTKEVVPDDYDKRNPEQRHIYKFVRTLFSAAQLTVECAIITLVYLERLLTYAEIDMVPSNWKRIVLGAVLLASKVWDDQAVWNVDYCQILKDTTVEDMNELERQYLEMIQFNINVPSSVYAKYYFHLRSLAEANSLLLASEILSKDRALKLEAMSHVYWSNHIEGSYINGKGKGDGARKKWSSLENVSPLINRAVIS